MRKYTRKAQRERLTELIDEFKNEDEVRLEELSGRFVEAARDLKDALSELEAERLNKLPYRISSNTKALESEALADYLHPTNWVIDAQARVPGDVKLCVTTPIPAGHPLPPMGGCLR